MIIIKPQNKNNSIFNYLKKNKSFLPFVTSFNSQYVKKPKLITILLELWEDKILTNTDFKKRLVITHPNLRERKYPTEIVGTRKIHQN